MIPGKVYLVGAGPGGPDLITVRGLQCLRRAQVVVYDRLASRSLLAEVDPDCELIYAGKEGGGPHAMSQEEISGMLVQKAQQGLLVCRLKGGDPFVFGRGGEEADTLRRAGIRYEVVPGVTAGLGATAFAGIPVTHRGLATSVIFVTGHEAAEISAGVDWPVLGRSNATLVCYMSTSRLPDLCSQLVEHGRRPDTPAAAIHWGTRAEQQVVTTTLAQLPEAARGLAQPALVVIGPTVALREALAWAEEQPLFGRRILVAFAGDQAETVAAEIREQGGEPWTFPRRPGGPFPHEVELLRRELAEGGIHQVLLTGTDAEAQLREALDDPGALAGLPIDAWEGHFICVCLRSRRPWRSASEWVP